MCPSRRSLHCWDIGNPAWPASQVPKLGESKLSLKLSLACEQYDRVQAIFDGRVRIEGCEVNPVVLHAEEAFHRAYNGEEFDVTELSDSSYTMAVARNVSKYIAVPAFVSKYFRHSAIFIRKDRGIKRPQVWPARRLVCRNTR